jgi:hypothetical protein
MLRAQDLAPRAYVITALQLNAVTLTWSFYDRGLNFNGTVPVTGGIDGHHVYTKFSAVCKKIDEEPDVSKRAGIFSSAGL